MDMPKKKKNIKGGVIVTCDVGDSLQPRSNHKGGLGYPLSVIGGGLV
jgi:hypothetical protein